MSFYFCTVVLTTVGFGDILPVNDLEVLWLILMMWVTGLTWAWVVANIVNVIANADLFGVTFNQTMDGLNILLRTRHVGNALRYRIRRHLYESQNVHRYRHQLITTTWLSAGLQGELAIQSGVDEVMNSIWYLRKLQPNIVVELALHFKPHLFSPNEFIMDQQSIFVICKGSCMKRGKLLGKGAVLGEDMILASEHLKDTTMPRTLSFTEVNKLERSDLMDVCNKFPELDQKIRTSQKRLAVRRAFVLYAMKTARVRQKEEEKRMLAGGGNIRKSGWDSYYLQAPEEAETKEYLGWSDSLEFARKQESRSSGIAHLKDNVKAMWTATNSSMDKSLEIAARLDGLTSIVAAHEAESQEQLNSLEQRLVVFDKMAELMQSMQYRMTPNGEASKSKSFTNLWSSSPSTPKSPKARN